MRLLTGTKWGANSYTLRTMYFALIRSKIDYGCEVYNSATHTVTKLLDSIQFQSLRICTGSMKSVSLASLQVEMGDPPYDERRKSLIGKSYFNINSFDNTHPTKNSLEDDIMFRFYDKNIKSKQKPYCITAQDVFRENNFNPDNVYSYCECPIPPGHLQKPLVQTQLHNIITKKDLPHLIKSEGISL